MKTNVLHVCFDDSALVSDDNFEFMKLGNDYECKIELFGEIALEKGKDVLVCKILNKDIFIGKKVFVSVLVEKDTYYIYQEKIKKVLKQNSFLFDVSRKDIIQVNNTIHHDLV